MKNAWKKLDQDEIEKVFERLGLSPHRKIQGSYQVCLPLNLLGVHKQTYNLKTTASTATVESEEADA